MSQTEQISAYSGEVRGAIARAAQATGVDFNYLLAQAKLESGLDPSAQAKTSSAAGLFQFTSGTWLQMLDRHGAEHGLGWADAAIEGGRLRDRSLQAPVMAMRFDPELSARMAAELANDNRMALTGVLGRQPDAAELYMAHFLGVEGAGRFLSALQTDPGQSAASLLPKAAAANRAIFFDESGAPRSVGAVMALMRGKVADAMEGGAAPSGWDLPRTSIAMAPDFGASMAATPQSLTEPPRASMAQTLRDTFALAGNEAAPAHVRAAYDKLQAFGL